MAVTKDKRLWEEWEDDVIARIYPVEGWRGVKRALQHRTRGALSSRANKLGIKGQARFSRPRGASKKPGTYLLPWPKADVEACQLLREWRGPTNLGTNMPISGSPNLGLRP